MAENLIKSTDVQGLHLIGQGGAKLGTVREMFVDLALARIEFFLVEVATLLGGSGKFHPVPSSAIRYDSTARTLQCALAKGDLKASPSYDRDQLANPGYGWEEQARRYFSPWDPVASGAHPP